MTFSQKIASLNLYQPVLEDLPIRLDANESCFSLPRDVLSEIAEAVKTIPYNRYPDPVASEVCRLMGEFCGVPGDRVVAGNGSDELISVIISALPRKARVVISAPDFDMYRVYASLCESELLPCGRVAGRPDVDALIERGKDADAVILSNPCNPTGQGLGRDETLRLLDNVSCLCVIDEAYMDFWDQSVLGAIDAYPHLLVLKTCSKNIGLAGIRLGFALANRELAGILRAVKSPYNVNAVTQSIGAVLLRRPQLLRENTRKILQAKEELTKKLATWVSGRDDCSLTDTVVNFVLLQTEKAGDWHAKLKERGIAVRLCPDALRITAGLESETDALMDALEEI